MSEQFWELPKLQEDDFHYRVGTSLLREFAVGHSPADVLRELVQNEYDAGGRSMEVTFGPDALTVQGHGAVIDARGWNRLSVMLGTGAVAGSSTTIYPKVNGIGSKNFGLRSLFLFGDRIGVASGGRLTVLDWHHGALSAPISHPPSDGHPGVVVTVPYRRDDDGPLRAFDERRERDALADIAAALAPTLVKLPVPGAAKGVGTVVVRSERLGHELTWRQSVRELPRRSRPLSRRVKVTQQGRLINDLPGSFTEIEYRRLSLPPKELRGRDLPAYFRAAGGRVRVAVSFQTRGRRVVRDAAGSFYYPLGANRSRTGFPFSVSAPFDMTEDRNQLVDVANSDWNAWLIGEAASFAVALLREDLFEIFGTDAYLALDPAEAQTATVPRLVEAVEKHLRSEPCWPTQAQTARRKAAFGSITGLTVASDPPLREVVEAHVPRKDLLHSMLAGQPDVADLAGRLGAKLFTVNSLIRLRCAGGNLSGLKTQMKKGEASRSFTDFPRALASVDVQVRIARALDGVRGKLSSTHKEDLRHTRTTLTAAGTLSSPDKLWIADERLTVAVPDSTRLHPALMGFCVLSGLCTSFQVSRWVIKTAERAAKGDVDEASRDALQRYLLETPKLSSRAWAAARRAPVLLDHRGTIASAEELVRRTASGARIIEPALRFLPVAAEKKPLVEQLRIRSAIHGEDLVRLGRLVEARAVPATQMRQALQRFSRLLTPAVVKRLRDIEMLEAASGALVAPAKAYERNERTVAALGDDVAWAAPLPGRLLQRLGCRTEPAVDDIVARLSALEDANAPLDRPDVVYRLLVEATKAERRDPAKYRYERILWTGRAWVTPDECLVGSEHRSMFTGAVPVLVGAKDAYLELGARAKPTSAHWRSLFAWIDRQYRGGPVPRLIRDKLTRAYPRLDAPPDGVLSRWRILLDDRGQLHSLDEAASARYLVDDHPALAAELRRAGAAVAFAYMPDDALGLPFLLAAGAKRLSEVARLDHVAHGEKADEVASLRVANLLKRLHDPGFASALAALAASICGSDAGRSASKLEARFRLIGAIDVVASIQRHYRVAGVAVAVDAEHDETSERIVVASGRTHDDVRVAVARAIAAITEPSGQGEQLLADPIYFLLRCRTPEDLQRELQRRKVPWKPDQNHLWSGDDGVEDAESEEEELNTLSDAIGRVVVEAVLSPAAPPAPGLMHLGRTSGGPTEPSRAQRPPLPDPREVRPRTLVSSDVFSADVSRAGGSAGASSWWPRTSEEIEEDRALGRYGEELVLRRERKKVAALGMDPSRVIWTADANPAANHDIRSVDADGEDLWIEVKTTRGRSGRFSWQSAEFRLAVRTRDRYLLCRVYEADTLTPPILELRDPIGLFQSGQLPLNLDSLTADAGTLDAKDQ